jgi:hypothetical protein
MCNAFFYENKRAPPNDTKRNENNTVDKCPPV